MPPGSAATAPHLFVDTETTGLPRGGEQPRIVSIAWIVAAAVPAPPRQAIIRPEGFTIPGRVAAIHGITTQRARREGRPLRAVLAEFAADIAAHRPAALVAHNLAFDLPIIEAEYARLGLASPLGGLARTCTLHAARRRWPGERCGLQAVHARLFGEEFEGAHGAAADVAACARIFFGLQAGDHAPPPSQAAEALVAAILLWALERPEFDSSFVASIAAQIRAGRSASPRQVAALQRIARHWHIRLPAAAA
ncbi:3'-5' exonuclease [Siccirubricoccus sp. G192]|uniref:3'-5' exonuclease n=1 Tax=Siccirubricoccus sp. G192 TaxID=2849651 RepID=UPI001C2C7FB6|nr:3'-5' exonuclease [Siccirubricoccus sp. G192]MBV1796322.1 3'-5' exonuclease [Siccirubricoccus sp. G192]